MDNSPPHKKPKFSSTRPPKDKGGEKSAGELSSEMVFITAGDPLQSQPFHKSLLCARSFFYNAFFNGDFKEAGSDTHHVEGFDFDVIQSMYVWLHTGALTPIELDPDDPTKLDPRTVGELFRLHCWAEQIGVARIGDQIIYHIMRALDSHTSIHLRNISDIFETVSTHSPLEQYLIDCVIEQHLTICSAQVKLFEDGFELCPRLSQAVVKQLLTQDVYSTLPSDKPRAEVKLKRRATSRFFTRDATNSRYHSIQFSTRKGVEDSK